MEDELLRVDGDEFGRSGPVPGISQVPVKADCAGKRDNRSADKLAVDLCGIGPVVSGVDVAFGDQCGLDGISGGSASGQLFADLDQVLGDKG